MPKKPDERALKYARLCAYRKEGREEAWIASELKLRSPEALYQQLHQNGFPICTVCGETPVQPGHCDRPRKKRQPDLGSGRKITLPEASHASSMFHQTLEVLKDYICFVDVEESWLEGTVEEGQFKGKHFITHSVDRGVVLESVWREEYTEEEWRKLCEQHGVDPGRDPLSLGNAATPGGVHRTPSSHLNALIATYALTYQPLTPLIEALHPDPESADMEKLHAKVDELRKVAGHLAVHVRGGVLERGRGVEEVSREEHLAAWLIRSWDEAGVSSDEEILERLKKMFPEEKYPKEQYPHLSARLTPGGIKRTRGDRLEPPQ